ncbi:hypothetical protein [Streptomyces albidochromogenes]|uniref:Chitinase n=1 Tax=Streptomyces albidochromogenes TaxID=329524 RepID=A0ABW6FQ76_9ACTN
MAAAALLTGQNGPDSSLIGKAAASGPTVDSWSVDRDRPCTGGGAGTCSGVSQRPWDFTRVFAQYNG